MSTRSIKKTPSVFCFERNAARPIRPSTPEIKENSYYILLLGETGCGKSTIINTLTNYYRYGSMDSIKRAIPTKYANQTEDFLSDELNVRDGTTSKTRGCFLYTFQTLDGKNFTYIDTPGLCDTSGMRSDDENLTKITDAVVRVGFLNAIVIVINGSVARLTVNIESVLSRLRGSLPDIFLENILVTFTNCRKTTCNFELSSLGVTPLKEFYMNNSIFSCNPTNLDPSDLLLSLEWDMSMQTSKSISDTVETMSAKTTAAFYRMQSIRHRIKTDLHNAFIQVQALQEIQDQLAQAEATLGGYIADVDKFKHYAKTRIVRIPTLIEVDYYSTLCSACNYVCHHNCTTDRVPDWKSYLFFWNNYFENCCCMNGKYCSVCPGECSFTTHYHDYKIVHTVVKTLEEVLLDVKEQYDKASERTAAQMALIDDYTSAKALVTRVMKDRLDKLVGSCRKLKRICSGFNLLDELHGMLRQIEHNSQRFTSADARSSAVEIVSTVKHLCSYLPSDIEEGEEDASLLWEVDI